MRVYNLGKMLREELGFTLVEILVVLAILGLVAIPAYDALVNSTRLEARAYNQGTSHNDARKIINEIVDGFSSGGQPIGGLRGASQYVVREPDHKAIAFHVTDKLVSYFLENGGLYRSVHTYQGTMEIRQDGAVLAVDNVSLFKGEADPANAKLINISLEVAVNSGNPSNGSSQLETSVRIRNSF